MYSISNLYDLDYTLAKDYLAGLQYPWEALAGLSEQIRVLGASLDSSYNRIAPEVWVHSTACIAPTASIVGPCIIGPNTQVRHGAFIRGSALIGGDCVVGNSVEVKNALLFDGVQVPHFNYVGDSILGYKAHLGAGAVTSNVRGDKQSVIIRTIPPVNTGRKKVGAMLGDGVEIGCNSVLNPGTVIGKNVQVYPCSSVRGVVPAGSIYKSNGQIVARV